MDDADGMIGHIHFGTPFEDAAGDGAMGMKVTVSFIARMSRRIGRQR